MRQNTWWLKSSVHESGAAREDFSQGLCIFSVVWPNAINGTMCFSSLMIARHYRLLSVSNETPQEKIMQFNNMLTALTERKKKKTLYLSNYPPPRKKNNCSSWVCFELSHSTEDYPSINKRYSNGTLCLRSPLLHTPTPVPSMNILI